MTTAKIDTDAYLRRIGAGRPAAPDEAALRELQLRHLRTVPFENLSIHLGDEIVLDGEALVRKIVERGRGGFCYELNGAFAELLTALGFRVTLLAGRVMGPTGEFGVPFDHLALRVDTPEPWLVDVGFGQNAHHPLRYAERGEQTDPGGVFRIAEAADGDLEVFRDGKVQYRLEQRPRELVDFVSGCWWNSTSPKAFFTQSLICSRLTPTGRVTLSGRTFVTTDATGRQERRLTEEEVLPAYRTHFGIELDHEPEVRAPGRAA
ncbi:acetyltransferase [Streptomyces eurocidicus]|uniref:Acetyltransferase n=1 Tax=Streptomyces eurocidicus TaxID=66423 RepID=A0A2N8P2R0_STREU|nr:arylamine N-acetyltransferase [Streptomyces eurocidicus]MBB5117449.1 N-hydroxyarylamine O-acetyltransferase [Streptomyces eurocidicus]MBF6053292.1 arylamine N-acetyltransferase [Streptomyces eurocidicus]PNE35299.1 acetyltransferase [Streptomyces eurocidicus]